MQPSWDPWFADGARLAFFSGKDLVVASADGRTKQVLLTSDRPAGLAVPSPNGESIAYVTFKSRPTTNSSYYFWGGTTVWVTSAAEGSAPRQVTQTSADTTTGLRWLGNDSLVFDRIGEELISMRARIWTVRVH